MTHSLPHSKSVQVGKAVIKRKLKFLGQNFS